MLLLPSLGQDVSQFPDDEYFLPKPVLAEDLESYKKKKLAQEHKRCNIYSRASIEYWPKSLRDMK